MGPTPSSSHTPPCSRFPSGASRRAGTQADAAGGGAAAVRRGAEPSHRLARPPRRCRGGHVAQPQARASGGRHVRRRRGRHRRGGTSRSPGSARRADRQRRRGRARSTGASRWEGLLATWSKDPVSWLIGQALRERVRAACRRDGGGPGGAQLLPHDPVADRHRRPRGAHRVHRWRTAGAVAGPGRRRRWTARGGRVPGIAGDAAHLACHLDTRDRAGNRHRPGCGAGDGTCP